MTPNSRRIYQKFRNSSLDPSAVGIVAGEETSYFSTTPENALVIAWAESYGIHFCTIGEESDTIYLVEPGADSAECVRPVASNILEFFGLIVACKHVSVLWQAQDMDRETFRELLAAEKPGMKQRSVLRAITNIYNPPVISDPYSYMSQVRDQNR